MEKNVPLLKLIHDPWSIKTMLSSRPSASSRSHPRQQIRRPGGGVKKRRGRGWREGYSFLSVFPRASGCFVVVFQSRSCGKVLVLSRLWEFSLIPNGKNRIDRSLKSPREGGRGEDSLLPVWPTARRCRSSSQFSPALATFSHGFSNSSSSSPEFERSTLESSLFIP